MSKDFNDRGSAAHVRHERERARDLRASRWWQTQLAGGVCYYCQQVTDRQAATMDHIVPVTQGGTSTAGNVVLACKPCNTKKSDMTAVEWALAQLKG